MGNLNRKNQDSGVLPNFLGIGAQKGGTSWLSAMLRQHPQICLPRDNELKKKELKFFDNPQYENLEIKQYKRFFEHFDFNHYNAIGEITPGYLWTSPFGSHKYSFSKFRNDIPKRVYNLLGQNIKLIVLLRNPVFRAISGYFHHVETNKINIGDSILEVGKRFGIIQMGFYSKHLCNWMEYYPLSSFNITMYEKAITDKNEYLKDIFQFLNVDKTFEPSAINKARNKKISYQITSEGVSVFKGEKKVKAITLDDIKILYEIYQEDMEQLEKLFDIDVSQWRTAYEKLIAGNNL